MDSMHGTLGPHPVPLQQQALLEAIPVAAVECLATLRSLQLGMGWLPEQAGNGLDRVFHALIGHLPAVGVAVEGLVVGSDGVRLQSGQRVRAFATPAAPLIARFGAARSALRSALARHAPDVVAAHFAPYIFPALDLLGHCPLIIHFHGPWADESSTEGSGALAVCAKAAIERWVYHRGDLFIVLSNAFARLLRDSYGVDPARIRIVPGGVDMARFDTGLTRREARERLGWPTDRPILLTVRRLRHRMGLESLLEAFGILHRRRPEAMLFIAGSGPLGSTLQVRIAEAGLTQHVRLLGLVPEQDLPVAYRAADLSVVPSVALEGFGLVTVESLAAGTPALVTPVGGLPEVIGELAPQLVLADATPCSIAQGLAAALDGGLPLPDAEACRRHARDRFGWASIARQTRRVYEEALRG